MFQEATRIMASSGGQLLNASLTPTACMEEGVMSLGNLNSQGVAALLDVVGVDTTGVYAVSDGCFSKFRTLKNPGLWSTRRFAPSINDQGVS